jgi:hypothetical protein
MAFYAYKTVRDLLPDHIIKSMGDDYEGAADYDGDQWYAAEAYINELVKERDTLRQQLEAAQKDGKRIDWLESSNELHGFCGTGNGEYRYYCFQQDGYKTVREVIDAAIAKEQTP